MGSTGISMQQSISTIGHLKRKGGTPEVTPVEIRALPERATQIAEAGSPVL